VDAQQVIQLLRLEPHPDEGGFYRETYRSLERISEDALPARFGSMRPFGTAIYYLLTPETFSAFHRLKADEVFHFYLGDLVTMVRLYPNGLSESVVLGQDLEAGQTPQCVVFRGTWQGSYLNEGGRFALLGATVAPGFEFSDFELGDRARLLKEYPNESEAILRLTKLAGKG